MLAEKEAGGEQKEASREQKEANREQKDASREQTCPVTQLNDKILEYLNLVCLV